MLHCLCSLQIFKQLLIANAYGVVVNYTLLLSVSAAYKLKAPLSFLVTFAPVQHTYNNILSASQIPFFTQALIKTSHLGPTTGMLSPECENRLCREDFFSSGSLDSTSKLQSLSLSLLCASGCSSPLCRLTSPGCLPEEQEAEKEKELTEEQRGGRGGEEEEEGTDRG